ncbi:type II toxin-antitoxin system MqsA family antitoxin [Pseudomonas sp. KCJK8670]|uniref:type II toxin-antitoxin system MqsA family antitoxin n=1 Tax=Pseudomonas sp. KCJK8670 TaxID=3344558 RepID=UPI003906A4EE
MFSDDCTRGLGWRVNAFSRWENGKMRPPVALIELFKLLDRRPELFEEIRTP